MAFKVFLKPFVLRAKVQGRKTDGQLYARHITGWGYTGCFQLQHDGKRSEATLLCIGAYSICFQTRNYNDTPEMLKGISAKTRQSELYMYKYLYDSKKKLHNMLDIYKSIV